MFFALDKFIRLLALVLCLYWLFTSECKFSKCVGDRNCFLKSEIILPWIMLFQTILLPYLYLYERFICYTFLNPVENNFSVSFNNIWHVCGKKHLSFTCLILTAIKQRISVENISPIASVCIDHCTYYIYKHECTKSKMNRPQNFAEGAVILLHASYQAVFIKI